MAEPLTRREFFTWWRDVPRSIVPSRPAPDENLLPPFLRPPGAAEEEAFLAACERCHKCVEACPYDVILPLGPAYGERDGTPAILPRGGPCRLCDGLPCAAACPTGALRPVPVDEVRMGTARLDPSLCWAVKGQPCDYCVTECPLGEKAIRWDGDRPAIREDGCVGCGMCVFICTAPSPALEIRSSLTTIRSRGFDDGKRNGVEPTAGAASSE